MHRDEDDNPRHSGDHLPRKHASIGDVIHESTGPTLRVILSFDVEEHDRIEAASGLDVDGRLRDEYAGRVRPATGWLLDALARAGQHATFFILGSIAAREHALIRRIVDAGHEVASHGWDHRRILEMTPAEFAEDLRKSTDALEQASGTPVVGYRAPTFSLVRQTAWAVDVMAEAGLLYDSSIYPVRHDRYGVPSAPRVPFRAAGEARSILEIPPATLRVGAWRVPVGGGGYFRLFPPPLLRWALSQVSRGCSPPVAMLYFHPWEFEPDQPRLPLRGVNRFRTYVGIGRTRDRLGKLLGTCRFDRAADVARSLLDGGADLPTLRVAGENERC